MKLGRRALRAHPLPAVVDGGKETKGRILIVAGSREVPGAALLTATAAMRAGAGKLRIATVESVAIPIGVAMPEAMVTGLAEDRGGGFAAGAVRPIAEVAVDMEAVVAGPGIKGSRACPEIAAALIDAEAALALDVAMLKALQPPTETRRLMPILLPDVDELASLLDCGEDDIERDPVGCGRRAAERYRAVVLVKGVTSHVVTPDGDVWTYAGGAAGLGVSGSGDALAGIVGGLLARGAEPLNALLWAVWLHGQAGARLTKKVGPLGLLAREIADEIATLLPG